jgi:hypothetical protein
MDAGRKWWTLVDGFIREIIQRRPPKSIDFRLPLVRNQQVRGSSPRAGSRISQHKLYCVYSDRLIAIDFLRSL